MNRVAEPEALLAAADLQVLRGGVEVLHIPRLDVMPGEALVLIGPNGAGKSTLLLTLAGLLKPSRGTLWFHGNQIAPGGYDYRRRIAMVFQEPLLFDTTVFDNVASGLKIRGMAHREIDRTVPEYLEWFGIAHLRDRFARKLSGGEAQRTSLARAFVTRPEIVFLDEPFAALDSPTRDALAGDLERILRQTHTTMIASTHDQAEALRLADRMAMMRGGRILQLAPPDEVLRHPVDAAVAAFVGMENILPGKVVGASGELLTVALTGGAPVSAHGAFSAGEEALVCIRPEDVAIARAEAALVPDAGNVFAGTIREITPLGVVSRLRVDCGFPLVAYAVRPTSGASGLAEGLGVSASFSPAAVHLIRP